MIKQGFSKLETAKYDEHDNFYDQWFLPDKLKVFLTTFNIKWNNVVAEKFVNSDGRLTGIPYGCHTYKTLKVLFSGFVNVDEKLDEVTLNEKLVIGSCGGFNGGIEVGLQGRKRDRVFLVHYSSSTEEFIYNNVFLFIRGQFCNSLQMNPNFDYDNLTKYWGNQYWTPKGNEDVIPFDSHPIPGEPFYRYIPERGFTFIGTRKIDDDFDFTSLEALIKVPFRLHTFLEHFKFEGEKGFHIEKIYDEQNDQIIQFGELIYEPLLIDDEKVKIESFLKEDEFLKSIQMLAENPLWINHRIIPIGRTKNGYQIGVKIDLLDDQKEEVWLVRDASSTLERENTVKLSDDIFKFIRGLVAAYDHNYFERIYQKWGEDFWRIKSN